jgi:hypothetical protein
MAEDSAGKVLGALVSAAVAALPSLTAGFTGVIGSMLATVLSVLGGICGPVAFLIYRRYVGVLGAGARPKGSPARLAYDALRENLSEGNIATRLYARWLSAFLDAVDRFFGDAGLADRTLFPRAFGLKTPAPLWTAPAFDRCLTLALIYPIVTIFVIWAVSGHVGPAEAALGLKPELTGWRRGVAIAVVGFPIFAYWRAMRTKGWKFCAWFTVISGAFGFAVAVIGPVALAVALVAVGAFAVTGVVAVALAIAIAVAVAAAVAGAIAIAFAAVFAVAFAIVADVVFVVAIAIAIAFAIAVAIPWLSDIAVKHGWQGVFLSIFLFGMILVCPVAANLLSPLETWDVAGPLLLFLGLLTLLNAPFDWASLGLTRALLRRGLELSGWWPYLLALVDAVLAAVIVAALALTMVIGVQAFDGLAVHGGGKPVLDLDDLFDGIAAHPADPEYWWLYALLLSTVIPSLINLMIGGASLLRGVPGLPSLILRFMPVGKAVPTFERNWIALVLTLQVALGAILGVAAQALLVVGVIGYVMPWLGLGLLDMARDVAAFNLPLRIGQLFAGIF